jgi:hypothetical protein
MTTDQLIEEIDGLDDDGIKTIAEKAKTLQRHIDRRVSGAVDTAKAKATAEPDPATVLEAKEKLLERKETVLSLAVARGLDPKAAFALLGIDSDSTDEDRLDAIAEYAEKATQDTKDQILKDHARNPRKGDPRLSLDPMSLEEINELSDAEILAMPESIMSQAFKRYDVENSPQRKTLRRSIAERIRGAK